MDSLIHRLKSSTRIDFQYNWQNWRIDAEIDLPNWSIDLVNAIDRIDIDRIDQQIESRLEDVEAAFDTLSKYCTLTLDFSTIVVLILVPW